jgi:cyclopropane-fatty-acyl-phospholipid synthase
MATRMPSTLAGSGVTAFDQPPSHSERSAHGITRSRVTRLDRWICAQVQRSIATSAVRLELWDGSAADNAPSEPIGDLLVRDRRTLIGLATNPDLWFGEGYMARRLDVRGSVRDVFEGLSRASLKDPSWRERASAALAFANTLSGSRRNVQHHYDLGNKFYELWLDPELVYTCAYFPDRTVPLEAAQYAKLDLVCRKLRLTPGEIVCEAGCGWGALALHMARHYGVRVTAFNVSKQQLDYARSRAVREGLTDRVEFVDDDYRNAAGKFDAFVSVGMLEHVGLRHFSSLAAVLRRTIHRNGGRGLLHFIGRDVRRPLNTWMRRRIFPGAYPPTLAEVTTRVLAPAGMSVIDVENLRLHYARTLALWGERFAAAEEQVIASFGDEFTRAWKLYLSGSEAAFATGWMQLFQVVFAPRESNPPSWTRSDSPELPGFGA